MFDLKVLKPLIIELYSAQSAAPTKQRIKIRCWLDCGLWMAPKRQPTVSDRKLRSLDYDI